MENDADASFMPDHARWFATSAEGLGGVDAVAERLPRAEGPRGRCLGVRVRRTARKRPFATESRGAPVPIGREGGALLAPDRASRRAPCVVRAGRTGRAGPEAPPAGARRARRGSTAGVPDVAGRKEACRGYSHAPSAPPGALRGLRKGVRGARGRGGVALQGLQGLRGFRGAKTRGAPGNFFFPFQLPHEKNIFCDASGTFHL